jgi:ABC-2 type transport system ATP-binding protein
MTKDDFEEFSKEIQFYPNIEVVSLKLSKYQATVHFNDTDINAFISLISKYSLKFFSEIKFTLEDHFMKFYDRNSSQEGGTT